MLISADSHVAEIEATYEDIDPKFRDVRPRAIYDEQRARLVGAVLTAAGAGSRFLADAHVVAAAVDRGGGVVLTGDVADMERLAASFRSVTVVDVGAGD